MSKSNAALIGALIATVVLSVVMLLKSMLGLLPSLNTIQMLTGISANILGTPAMPAIGWIWHFIIGVGLWGVLFAALYEVMPGTSSVAKGLLFSTAAWLLMMLIVMPLAGAGLFGINSGLAAPIATLVLHLIYGLTLGYAFGELLRQRGTGTSAGTTNAGGIRAPSSATTGMRSSAGSRGDAP